MRKENKYSVTRTAGERVILGIDPGTNIMGYGIIKVSGINAVFLDMDVLILKKIPDHFFKLKNIFEETIRIIETFKPDEVALEAPFYGKNVQSMLKLGRAQGIAMAAALHRNLPVFEYAPRKVKQSITGNGTSTKEQVAIMLQRILSIKSTNTLLDATDALAVAICHHFNSNSVLPQKRNYKTKIRGTQPRYNSWESFVTANIERVR